MAELRDTLMVSYIKLKLIGRRGVPACMVYIDLQVGLRRRVIKVKHPASVYAPASRVRGVQIQVELLY
jgi:hypothetical protein